MSLKDAKKFFLIDPTNVNQLTNLIQSSNRLQPIQSSEIKRLDSSMLDILNNNNLTTTEKVEQYNKILVEFQNTTSSKPQISDETKNTFKTNQTENDKEDSYNYLLGIPTQYKTKADKLMSMLINSNKIKISKTGSVTINGESIPGSNITDLVNKAVNSRVTFPHLPGWSNFEELIIEQNVPQSLLSVKVEPSVKKADIKSVPKTSTSKPKNSQPHSPKIVALRKWLPHDHPPEHGKKKKK